MATRNSTCSIPPVSVEGWAGDNYCSADPDRPAVIINPEADPLQLLYWTYGQFKQLTNLVHALTVMDAEVAVEPKELAGVICHFSEQGMTVLNAAIGKLHAQRRNAERSLTSIKTEI